jgi:hypothetical protein
MFHVSPVLKGFFFWFNYYDSTVHNNSIVIAFIVNKNVIQLSDFFIIRTTFFH